MRSAQEVNAPEERHVPLQRRFREVAHDPSTFWSKRLPSAVAGERWDALVSATPLVKTAERNAIVILAPSGMGKTAELAARAAELRQAGVAAFFMTAVEVGALGVEAAIHEKSAFQAWRNTSARGVFFIDAVDEARLEGTALEHVLLRFARDVDPATRQLQVVISSRNDIWAADDVRHLVRVLALPTKDPPVRIVALEPLSRDDVEAYARARGVRDVGAFMVAFVEEELEQLFDLRPPDVRVLVDYWNQNGEFGTWSKMLQAAVDASIRNENRKHSLKQQFTLERARGALRRLAAATVLGKRPLVSMPGKVSSATEVDAERLFCDQTPAETSQLLAMGLFMQKGARSVQLPQGAPSYYLAALWLADRARAQWDLEALEHELFKRPFGVDRTFVPTSRAPLLGWVAGVVLMASRIRRFLTLTS
jgi:hypothetical protein